VHAHARTHERKDLQVTTPEPPPEARLIHELREAITPKLSMREAARRAGMSASLWTQYEQGYRKVTPLVTIPVTPTDDKLADMALVVGATPGQLREAGRGGAAAILQKLVDAGPDPYAQLVEQVRASRDLSERQKRALIELVLRDAQSNES
jgi:transcriptional regulator with XRE-family HTH domain